VERPLYGVRGIRLKPVVPGCIDIDSQNLLGSGAWTRASPCSAWRSAHSPEGAGGAYRLVLAGTDPRLPEELVLPLLLPLNVLEASDEAIVNEVAKLVARYAELVRSHCTTSRSCSTRRSSRA
jgi:hypothetical protein